jgi:hypothetical protein
VTTWAAPDASEVESAAAGAALFAEEALESLSWDASVLAEADAALPNPEEMDREKFCTCWPGVEICALGPIASWALD